MTGIWLYALDLLGTAVFAITGALVARGKHIDLYGVVVFGIVTAVGGGTLRDLLLGVRPVFWITDPTYMWVAAGAAVVTFGVVRVRPLPTRPLVVLDALGLALFTIIGAQAGLAHSNGWLIPVMMGILTGTGGGITRDLLAGEVPLVLQREIYATASMAGAALYVSTVDVLPAALNVALCMTTVTVLRLMSIHLGGSLPLFLERQDDPQEQR